MTDADTLYVDIKGRLDNMSFRSAEAEAERAGRGISGRFSSALASLPAVAATAAVAVGTALASGAAVAINKFADFQETLSGAQAVLGATAGEMEKLKAQALAMGAQTSFSASEAATAIEQLGSAGLSTADILRGGLKGALDLAAATGMKDLAEASEIAASSMNAFGLAGGDLAHVADLVAKAANVSALNVHDFGYAVAAGGSSAKAAGLSIEEFTSAVSLMADVGIKGSDAGTSLKSFLTGLIPKSKEASEAMKTLGLSFYDANGNMKDLAGIQETLKRGFSGLTQEERLMNAQVIFGTDGIRAFNTIIDDNTGKLNRNTDALRNSNGEAEKAARTRLDNIKGDLEQLKGSVESAAIAVGDTLATGFNLRPVLQNLTTFVNQFGPVVNDGLKTVLGAAKVFGGQLNTTLGPSLQQAQGVFKSVFTTLAPIVLSAFNAIVPVVRSLGPLVGAAFGLVAQVWQTILRPTIQALAPVFSLIFGQVAATVRSAVQIVTGVLNAVSALLRRDVPGALAFLKNAFLSAGETMGRAMQAAGQTIVNALRAVVPRMAQIARDIIEGLAAGVRAGVGRVAEAARNLATGVIDNIRNTLRIQSPSRVMIEAGEFVGQGLVIGMNRTAPDVQRAAAHLGSKVREGVVNTLAEGLVGIENAVKGAEVVRSLFGQGEDGLTAALKYYGVKTFDELSQKASGAAQLIGAAYQGTIDRQKALAESAREAQAATNDLADAQIKAANAAYQRSPQGAADAAFRSSFGAGDVGLIRSLAAVTGKTVAEVRADVEGALADARRFAADSATIIERVYADALTHRRDVTAQQQQAERDAAAGILAQNAALYAGLDDLGNAYAAEQERQTAREIEMAGEARDAVVQAFQDEQAAADDAALTFDFLAGLIAETVRQGRDPGETGLLEYLRGLTKESGQAAAAAQDVLDQYDRLLFRAQQAGPLDGTPVAARGTRPTGTPDPVAARGTRDATVQDSTDARGALTAEAQAWRDKTTAQLDAQRAQEAYRETLQGLTLAQLEQAKATALERGEAEHYAVIVQEIQTLSARPVTLTVQIAGIDTGIKQLDLYKSAIQGVADVVSGVFRDLVSGAEVSTTSILKSMALMALGIVKQVAVAVAAYEAQAIALALIKGGTFDFVGAAAALAAAAAVAGIVAGLEARLGQSAPRPTSGGTLTTGTGGGTTTPSTTNSTVTIPTSQVTVIAAPEWEARFGTHVDRFGTYVERLVREGVLVRVNPTPNAPPSMSPLSILTP